MSRRRRTKEPKEKLAAAKIVIKSLISEMGCRRALCHGTVWDNLQPNLEYSKYSKSKYGTGRKTLQGHKLGALDLFWGC